MKRYRVEITTVRIFLIDGKIGDEAAAVREALFMSIDGTEAMYASTPRVSVETVGEDECQQM